MSRATLNCTSDGTISISGEFGFSTASNLLMQGQKLMDTQKELNIDLGAVTSSDSAGLALMLEWLDRYTAAGQQLHFLNVPESLLEIARVSNLIDLLPLADT
jgi:phospholipid transport system transporter-binding protein